MKYKAPIVLAMIIAALIFSKPALANMDQGEHAEFIKSLRQASSELKGANPTLSDKLNGYADQKEKWANKKEGHWKQMQGDAGKLRIIAKDVQATRKDLTDELNAIADRYEAKRTDQKEGHWKQMRDDSGKLRAIATDLQSTRKDLSDELNTMADHCEMKWKDHDKE